ncbi:MAG TPA: acyltransferase [Thermoanaerobaculia bacterium]|nr:acyltransferase [Thermoanaerobaculia bacterium]
MSLLSGAVARLERSLSRVTSSGRFIPEIDGLRFIAIITVLLFHLNALTLQFYGAQGRFPSGLGAALDMLLRTGFIGVEVFFAISGFVLGLPFAMQRIRGGSAVRLPRYFLRRLTRIEPTYAVNMLALFLMKAADYYWWEGRPDLRPASMLPHLLASLFYSHNFVYGQGSTINNVAWSLEIEIQFYILAPLICSLYSVKSRILRRVTLLALGIGAATLDFGALTMGIDLRLPILRYLPFFVVGLMVADVFVADWHEGPRQSRGWSWLAAAGLAGMPALVRTGFVSQQLLNGVVVSARLLIGDVLLASCIAMLFVGAMRGVWASRILRMRPLVLIGGMCYTIYLYHQLTYHLLGHWTAARWSGLPYGGFIVVQGLVLLPGCVVICSVLFVLFEKPFMYPDWLARARAMMAPRR